MLGGLLSMWTLWKISFKGGSWWWFVARSKIWRPSFAKNKKIRRPSPHLPWSSAQRKDQWSNRTKAWHKGEGQDRRMFNHLEMLSNWHRQDRRIVWKPRTSRWQYQQMKYLQSRPQSCISPSSESIVVPRVYEKMCVEDQTTQTHSL